MKNTKQAQTSISIIASALLTNAQFRSRTITVEQVGNVAYPKWVNAVNLLRKNAYDVAVFCENNAIKTDSGEVDLTPIFTPLQDIICQIGEVNGFKLKASRELAIRIIGLSIKETSKKTDRLTEVSRNLSTYRSIYSKEVKLPNGKKQFIKDLQTVISDLESEQKALLSTAGECVSDVSIVSEKTFRLNFENLLGRIATEQKAKEYYVLALEREVLRRERAERNKNKRIKNVENDVRNYVASLESSKKAKSTKAKKDIEPNENTTPKA